MTQSIIKLEKSVAASHATPPTGDIIDGAPEFTTWKLEDDDGLRCGLWQCTPGKWSMTYTVWEYIRILEGFAIITPQDGDPIELRAGDSYILRIGFRCTWDVKETLLKEFVIRA
ncbi:cupin domain-containing protein [uncultured Sulfitobacter sp.]|uniref:cupin domain-containing protein n=1 Tax=uncultured Sulfitobacter sp. TaxID=191468 RepID=UPI00260F904D|nr:cupin domain-containing protein [uncultured Sulfitobacter sp.]